MLPCALNEFPLGEQSEYSLGTIFSLCDEIAQKYRFKLNIHVYGNLVHASIARKDIGRAVPTAERMVQVER